jgi:hypothetical protein
VTALQFNDALPIIFLDGNHLMALNFSSQILALTAFLAKNEGDEGDIHWQALSVAAQKDCFLVFRL